MLILSIKETEQILNSLTPSQLRHKLHQNPELAFIEFKTTELIISGVKALPGSDKLIIHTPFPTGVLFEYKVNDDPFILFRADIDALPIKEENEIDFKSTNDFMHACGHDVHTSILYSFLENVLRKKPNQNILFLFQPAEEAGGGAMQFYKTGVFNQFNVKNAFALHVTDEYPFGTIASTKGVLFASALEIDIEFIGESSHVAFPEKGKNAFNAMRKFLDENDELSKNYKDKLLFGIGKYVSGTVRNIAPGYAKLEGSIRGLSSELIDEYLSKLIAILKKLKTVTGVDYKITKGAHYPEVIVDDKLFDHYSKELSKQYNFIDCGAKMTGEDFGFFSQMFPSFMFWLGTSKGEQYSLHNPKFLPPDEAIEVGKSVFVEILNSVSKLL
ncbi:N-acetyldiaminopimelate deacetylase [bacterium BMS3Abin03]|nr:N-acetyldiaminopimelate deacetylase [bacterium BMS3Abin03]